MRFFLPLALTLALGSCSTVITTINDRGDQLGKPLPRIYAGTIANAGHLVGYYKPNEAYMQQLVWAMAFLDLPFSLVGDTILLSYTVYAQIRYGNHRPTQPVGPSTQAWEDLRRLDGVQATRCRSHSARRFDVQVNINGPGQVNIGRSTGGDVLR